MFFLYVVAKPLAFCLDKALGEEVGTIHSRTELQQLTKIHETHLAVDKAEADLIKGALNFRSILIKNVMTPLEDVYMLPSSTRLDFSMVAQIFRSGFSRIPVYEQSRNSPVGLLLTKDLILIDPNDAMELGHVVKIFQRSLSLFHVEQNLGEVFDSLKTMDNKSHMVLVWEVVDPTESGGVVPPSSSS